MTTTERVRRVALTPARERRLARLRATVHAKEAAVESARQALVNEVKEAIDAGEPITAVADASGYSRQWVHALITKTD